MDSKVSSLIHFLVSRSSKDAGVASGLAALRFQ
jgi:hypothetical protein